ncbi:MAG TPA: transporter substrate-binding domain-containing protein [Methylomirabilota bacterium]|jgi:polar amino acid transport system substrate-binding protein|nr:transporter substrate-binding domain-containing protein [Methylomirabilota bacterium]
MTASSHRRDLLKLGGLGVAAGVAAAGAGAASALSPRVAYAQAAPASLLRSVLDRGRLIVGTGSTNAPWHFEDDKGQLTGMDITMARILAKGLFDDAAKVEFVKQDPAARIPNITTGKVDVVIQFMTISPARAQLVAFSRPYYVEGAALLTSPRGKHKTFKQLLAAGKAARASVLQNVDADKLVRKALPQAQVMQLDTQANVIQALDSGRVDAAVVDLSTVRWLVKRSPDKYIDAGHSYNSMLYGAAMRQGDPDWLGWVNTCFTVAMYGHQNELYDQALDDFFGVKAPERKPGFPPI